MALEHNLVRASAARWLSVVAVACAVLAAVHILVTRWCWSSIPLQTDTGMWAYMGRRMLSGALPYRDLWESKPPGIYYLFAGVERLFGSAAVAVYIWLDALVSAGVMYATYRVARRCASAWAAGIMMLPLSMVFCHRILADWGCNLEKFVALFELAALGIVLNARSARGGASAKWFAAGALCACASLFKQTGVALLIAVTISMLAELRKKCPTGDSSKVGGLGVALAWLWGGFGFVWAIAASAMLQAGNFHEFVDQAVLYDLLRAGTVEDERNRILTFEHWSSVGEAIRLGMILFGPALVGFVTLRFANVPKNESDAPFVLRAYFVAALAPMLFAPFGYGHYLLQAAPVAAVIAAIWLNRLSPEGLRFRAVSIVAGSALAVWGAYSLGDHVRFTLRGDTENSAYAAQARKIDALVRAVQSRTSSSVRVMFWPPDAAASYYADRVTPLESANSHVLFMKLGHRLAPPMDVLLVKIQADPPRLIVDHTRLLVLVGEDAMEIAGSSPAVMTEPGVSLLEDADDAHDMLEGRIIAPLKRWVRADYGGQERVGDICTLYWYGRPWREWTEYLIAQE